MSMWSEADYDVTARITDDVMWRLYTNLSDEQLEHVNSDDVSDLVLMQKHDNFGTRPVSLTHSVRSFASIQMVWKT